jgi:hypothetical protein
MTDTRSINARAILAILVAFALPAYAQAPQQPAPCVRGANPATDELKCELAVVKQERSMAIERIDKLMAAATLLTNDLEAAKAAATKHEADLAEWFKGQFSTEGK